MAGPIHSSTHWIKLLGLVIGTVIIGTGCSDFSLQQCEFLALLQMREMRQFFIMLLACVSIYSYIMLYVTDASLRVSQLGSICVLITVIMQASPLASVVCSIQCG